jgi:hypothetical protein
MELRNWEYSFYFHTRNLGTEVRKGTNPFTNEPVNFPIDDGLTKTERLAIAKVMTDHGFNGPERHGEGYALYLPEDQYIRIRGGDLRGAETTTGFAVEIVVLELTDDVLEIMLQIARAGNLAFTSVTGEDVRLVDRPSDAMTLERWPDAKLIETTGELKTWLVDTIEGRQVLSFVE